MSDRELVQLLSLGRLSIGLALFVAPRRALTAWTGDHDPAPSAVLAARMLGARDAILGVGAMAALDRGAHVSAWLEAGALADASDALAGLLAWGDLPPLRRLAHVLSAGGAAVLGIRLAAAYGD